MWAYVMGFESTMRNKKGSDATTRNSTHYPALQKIGEGQGSRI